MLDKKTRAAKVSVASNTFLVLLKIMVGVLSGSVSILSEAVHSGVDLLAAAIAYVSVRTSGKPADDDHRYGHGKIESLSGAVEGLLIFVAAGFILYESGRKLLVGHVVVESVGLGAGVMFLSAVVNWFVSRYLERVAKETDSLALHADALHLKTDVWTSLGVSVGLLLIKITGIPMIDPIAAALVATIIVKAAWELTGTALSHILDGSLPLDEEETISGAILAEKDRFVDFHDLRTRKAGAERHVDLRLVVPAKMSVKEGHEIAHEVSDRISQVIPSTQTIIHVEPCRETCGECGKCSSQSVYPPFSTR